MTQIKQPSAPARPRVRKQDWLHAALDMLREGGIEAVRIERLADRVGVAKSGFYYHFRDREDLHQALLDYWIELDGAPAVEERSVDDATPAQRLAIVAEVVDRADLSRYDAAIRQWARQDPKVRRLWRKEMRSRLTHIRGLFAAIGFEGDALEMRTRTFLAYHAAERDMYDDLSARDRARLRALRLKLFLEP